jgi:hydroxymethylbilane synthase
MAVKKRPTSPSKTGSVTKTPAPAKKAASSPSKAKVSKANPKEATKAVATAAPKPKTSFMEFIGTFPIRNNQSDKKSDLKKTPIGPVFPAGTYAIGYRDSALSKAQFEEFKSTFLAKHSADSLHGKNLVTTVDRNPDAVIHSGSPTSLKNLFTKELDEAVANGLVQLAVHDMKDIPVDIPKGLVLGASLRREDPRDALVTRSTFGAIQELPSRAKLGTSSKRASMQIRALRPDIEIIPVVGGIQERLEKLEAGELDALVLPWASLRRLNISPRFYVALQVEHILPAPCQGIIGVICKEGDESLLPKLRYIEDSEASWASRCERAFLQKLGGTWDAPVGAYAHRKGTQDPWILDTVLGNPQTGEVIRHREIGTSRCKPESLADKAFTGILSKGARKFLPFT